MVQCRFGKNKTVPAELANLTVSLGQLFFDAAVDVRCGFRQALSANGIPVLVFQELLLAFLRAVFVPAWRGEQGKIFPADFALNADFGSGRHAWEGVFWNGGILGGSYTFTTKLGLKSLFIWRG